MNKTSPPLPITIRVGYEWTDRRREPEAFPPADRYTFILQSIKSVVDEVEARSRKRKHQFAFYTNIGRMRGQHGAELLPRFRDLCDMTDIVVFDITGENPNVMLELGMALATKSQKPGHVFILKQKTISALNVPTDLRGYLISYFHAVFANKNRAQLKFEDGPGFRGALRQRTIDIARERGMWGRGVSSSKIAQSAR